MMAALRAVGPDEKAPPKKTMTILEAVDAEDRLAELVATHRRIARAVQDEKTPSRDLASLTRRQLEISKEIKALRREQEEESGDGSISADEAWSEEAI